jgi:hypothetical protein
MAGIDVRHRRTCPGARADGKCCKPIYQAHVFDARTGKRIRKTFPTKTAAKLWRQDATVAVRHGNLAEARPKTSVREACDAWIADARAEIVRTRGGDPFKPGTIRAYSQALRLRVYPTLADAPFYRVRRIHLQDLVDQLTAAGVAPATINTTIGALGAIYGRAVHRDELDVSPTLGVKVPAARNGRERFATPQEATRLLAAVPEADRAVWATAMYAGLRRGEIMALRWTDIDRRPAPSMSRARGTRSTAPATRRAATAGTSRSSACCASASPPFASRSRPGPSCASASATAVRSAPTGCKSAPTQHGPPPAWSASPSTTAATPWLASPSPPA